LSEAATNAYVQSVEYSNFKASNLQHRKLMKAPFVFSIALCTLAAGPGQTLLTTHAAAQTYTPQVVAPPAGNQVQTTGLSVGLDEIVKLVKAGVDESVILVFIQRSTVPYNPDADEIIRLRELGVSSTLITALLRHGEALRQATAQVQKQTSPAPQPATVQPPAPTPVAPTTVVQAAPSYPVSYPNVVYTYPTYYGGYGGYYYPAAYPYYGGCYYGGYYPGISVGFAFGNGYCGRGYYGGGYYGCGYRGGVYYGGGYHGGAYYGGGYHGGAYHGGGYHGGGHGAYYGGGGHYTAGYHGGRH
jgi:hypothetical protein